jgi:hypothetical protein
MAVARVPRVESPPDAVTRPPFLAILSIITAATAVAGCAGEGPGAKGTINLWRDVDATGFETIAMRAFPNLSGAFAPAAPIPAGALARNVPLTSVTFPFEYELGAGTGVNSEASWQFVAWLSHQDWREVDGLVPGDIYCALPFDGWRDDMGSGPSGLTSGVDCYLATVVP